MSSESPQLPAPSFPGLCGLIATQAMAALGQFPDPSTGEPVIRLPEAKYVIDLLGILEEKSKGNLEQEEAAALGDLLHQLRMAYTTIAKQAE